MNEMKTTIEWRDGLVDKPGQGDVCVVLMYGCITTLKCWSRNPPEQSPQFEIGYDDPTRARWWAPVPKDVPENDQFVATAGLTLSSFWG